MIRVDEALNTILKYIKILDSEIVKLTDALGRVLAVDIYSDTDIPAFDNSAMDGYAVRSLDTQGASKKSPKILEVVEDLKAGYVTKKILETNQAMRIMTGAVIPSGADSVVIVEDTQKCLETRDERREMVKIAKEVKPGENIRRKGEDIKKRKLVISKGTFLNSAHIGLLASLGKAKVELVRRPKVAILATGDEVVDVKEKLKPGKLRSSNTYTLYSQVLNCGGIPKNLGIAKDEPDQLKERLKKGMDCDLILTSGGVSVGEYDLVKDVLGNLGAEMKFWKVAMRPGKPLVFGVIGGRPVFGLPGNPVSSMVSFEIFVRPAILRMLGENPDTERQVKAVLQEEITKKKGIRYFLRARTRWKDGMYVTATTGPQGSGILKSMAEANSLIILPEEEGFIEKGTRVTVRFLD